MSFSGEIKVLLDKVILFLTFFTIVNVSLKILAYLTMIVNDIDVFYSIKINFSVVSTSPEEIRPRICLVIIVNFMDWF